MLKNRESATFAGFCLLQSKMWGGHGQPLGSSWSCTAVQTRGRSRNLLVAIRPHCLFIRFQAATALHLGSLLHSACCKRRVCREFSVHTRVCSSSAAEAAPVTAQELPVSPKYRFPCSPPQAAIFLLQKSPQPALRPGL